MIHVQVRNKAGAPRTWQVEPYGDLVLLEHDDVLTIDLAHDDDLTFEVVIHPEINVLWPDPDQRSPHEVSVPVDLRVNGVSLWPSRNSEGEG